MRNVKNTLIVFVLILGLLVGITYQFRTINKQSQLILWQRGVMNQLCDKLDQRSHELASLTRYGGFMEMPVPPVGETLHLLILQSFNGGAVFSTKNPPNIDLLNTRFYVAYDMDNHRFLALQDSKGAIGGKDFMLFITSNPNGTRTVRPIVGPESVEIGEKFGLGFGPDRR